MSSVAVHMALYKNEFTINHELASSLFMSFIVVHELLAVSSRRLAVSPSRRAVVALFKMSSQSIMSLLRRCLVVHELHELRRRAHVSTK
jgi:hypothetical protein